MKSPKMRIKNPPSTLKGAIETDIATLGGVEATSQETGVAVSTITRWRDPYDNSEPKGLKRKIFLDKVKAVSCETPAFVQYFIREYGDLPRPVIPEYIDYPRLLTELVSGSAFLNHTIVNAPRGDVSPLKRIEIGIALEKLIENATILQHFITNK